MKLIISGKMASGKTTVSDYLVKTYGYYHIALADPVKEIEAALDKMSNNDIYNEFIGKYLEYDMMDKAIFFKIFDEARAIPREEPKPRKRLQFIGTDGVRKRIDGKLWIKLAQAHAEQCQKENIVIDDVRFINEFNYFVEHHWFPIKLVVSPEEQDRRLKALYGEYDPIILEHASEIEQNEILTEATGGLLIQNDTDLPRTFSLIDDLVRPLTLD